MLLQLKMQCCDSHTHGVKILYHNISVLSDIKCPFVIFCGGTKLLVKLADDGYLIGMNDKYSKNKYYIDYYEFGNAEKILNLLPRLEKFTCMKIC